jgi:Domain of unknown function (DUF4349)
MSDPAAGSTIDRDLAAIDAALESGVAGDADARTRELQELALELRGESPPPEPDFARRLRGRVHAGFPSEPGSVRDRWATASASLSRAPRRTAVVVRQALPAVGLIGAILVPLVVAITLAGPGGQESGDGGGAALGGGGGGAVEQPGGGNSGGSVAPAPAGPGTGFAPGQPNRRIERSVSLELDVPADEMARVAEDVTAVTNRHGGFVLSSSVNTGEDGGGGDFSLRIPAERLRPALRDLAALAPVIRQTQEGRDITRGYVTARDRLQVARAERRGLLRRLEDADTDPEVEAIRRRLDLVAREINGLRARLRDLRLRTDYAVVLVSLVADDESGASSGAGGTFDDAIGGPARRDGGGADPGARSGGSPGGCRRRGLGGVGVATPPAAGVGAGLSAAGRGRRESAPV